MSASDPPLFVHDEFVPMEVGKLDEQVGEVHVLEEALLGTLVVPVAWISNKGFVHVVRRFREARSFPPTDVCHFGGLHMASSLLAEVVGTLRITADAHVVLHVLHVLPFQVNVDSFQGTNLSMRTYDCLEVSL